MGRDAITGLVVLVASLALYGATLGIEQNPLVPISPAFYPRIVLGITAALGAILLAAGVIAHRRAGAGLRPSGLRPRHGRVVLMFALFGAYVLVLPYVGFRAATLAFVTGMQIALDPPRGMRRWAVVAAVAAAATFGTYFIFDGYLQVLLPRGRWTDF